MPTIRYAFVLLSFITISACGSTPTSPSLSLTGHWQGTVVSAEDGPGTITMNLTQTRLAINGSVLLSQSGLADIPGTLTGTLDSQSGRTVLRFTVTYAFGLECQGSFGGTFDVTAAEIDGDYSGQNCVHPFGGTLKVTRAD